MTDALSSAVGLTTAEARTRLAHDGPNALPPPEHPSAVRRFVDQLIHFFALMLWVAGGLALLAGLPQIGIAVFVVIVLNAIFAFAQESRADHAAERLSELLPRQISVRRDGVPTLVEVADVVVGDVLILEAGDRIPADARSSDARGLLVDTSLLTGESDATQVESEGELFAGTFVVEGEADAVVTAIGSATRLAGIARMTTLAAGSSSPLTRELQRVVRTIAVIAVGVGALFFGVSMLVGNPLSDGFVFAIGVTVALVPEALLPTVTLSLAWGAEQMAKRKVLVRQLEAVETLGSTTTICTDKTGTLTLNQMTVVEAWSEGGSAVALEPGYDPSASVELSDPGARAGIERVALAAVRCSVGFAVLADDEWRAHGDPMEAALDVFARRLRIDVDADRRDHPVEVRFPFDPRRRRMSVVVARDVIVKGAPESVLPLCGEVAGVAAVLEAFTGRGLRVLAVAGRPAGSGAPASADAAESDLELYGLVALEDPPRHDVADAITACRLAGIQVMMITGDHPATAEAIADEVGLRMPGALVISGDDLPSDDGVLGALVDHDGVVVARVSPEDKLRIARALRARGRVVAMTGDGVNDGPALHEADIGIAMGASGTDVAREASDLVLLDDHFATIVAGIEQGRAAFLNIRRFLTYHLTDNVAELTPFLVWALSGGRFPLALGVLQILALDIGTDTFSAVALGAEPPAADVLVQPPVSGRLMSGTVVRRAFGLLGPVEAAMSMAAFLISFLVSGWRPGDSFPTGHVAAAASGAAFMAVVSGQCANALACRSSTRWPGALGFGTNRLLPGAVLTGVVVSLCSLLIPPLARAFGQANPPIAGWVVAVSTGGVVLGVDALDKWRRRR